MSGGAPPTYGSTGAKAEAEVMKDYLQEVYGIPDEDIIKEPTAYHTLDNVIASKVFNLFLVLKNFLGHHG